MNLNFAAIILALGANAAFRIANAARVASDYLFASLLPERNKFTYNVEAGGMTIRATMAGLVGMDSPYPPGGMIDLSTFAEKTLKVANEVALSEQALRELQQMMAVIRGQGRSTDDLLSAEALNFLDKIIIQPHMDRFEWLRGKALLGSIAWEFGGKQVSISYGIPTGNVLTARTGNDGYGGSASKLWVDIPALRRALKNRQRALIATTATIDMIRYNAVNNAVLVNEINGVFTFRRINSSGQFTADVGDTFSVIAYDLEGDIIDPANPSVLVHVPFMPNGKLLAIGSGGPTGYVVGQGSASEDPNSTGTELGYTHIAPTVEGGGLPGRWAELYTPEARPYALHGRGVTNGLPVIEAPDKIAIATTDMV